MLHIKEKQQQKQQHQQQNKSKSFDAGAQLLNFYPLTEIWPDRLIVSFKKHCNNIVLARDSVEYTMASI